MKLHTFKKRFSVKLLKYDMNAATKGWDWSKGAYGHALSLPSKNQVHSIGQNHRNNLPFSDKLNFTKYFKRIYDDFKCEKTSFRLMRRGPESSYGWHKDTDKGKNVIRMQIPIVTNNKSYLIATNYDNHEQIKGETKQFIDKKLYRAFKKNNKGNFRSYELTPGRLYYFNTSKIHTLVNFGETQRITLLMDFYVNDWFKKNFPETLDEINYARGFKSKLFGFLRVRSG